MDLEQQIIYLDKNFRILNIEQEYLIHPTTLGFLPMTKASQQCTFSGNFHIEGYRLYLDKLILIDDQSTEKQYNYDHYSVKYNGAILIGTTLVKEYIMKGSKPACFSYQCVFELVFEDGILITAIDQSRAMLRIRKNIELGIRSLTKSRDIRCISRFMSSSFIGDYKTFWLPGSRMRYLKDMKKDYSLNN